MTMTTSRSIKNTLLTGLVLGMSLSGACKKPPPPPPPAPPPPPPVVQISEIGEQLKVDPRVTWRSDIQVTDESFITAALKLADAFARGDAPKAKELLDSQGQQVVTELVNTGQWDEASKKVEAVRIVFAAPPGELSDLERDKAIEQLKKQIDKDVERVMEIALQSGQPFEAATRIRDIARKRLESQLADIKAGQSAANGLMGINDPLNTIAFTNNLDASANSDKLEDIKGLGEKPAFVMLMAVQTPQGADLLGWTVNRRGDGFQFRPASTLPFAYARASDWDSVGMFGFSLNLGKVVPPKVAEEEAAAAKPAPAAPKAPDAPSGPAGPGGPGGPRGPRSTP